VSDMPREVPVPYKPMWVFSHIALICSFLLNIVLLIQLQRAKDVQEELIKDHVRDIEKQNKWFEQQLKPKPKDNWP
jgi:hypothetical protein